MEVHDAKPEEEGQKKLGGRRGEEEEAKVALCQSLQTLTWPAGNNNTSSHFSSYKCKQHQNAL